MLQLQILYVRRNVETFYFYNSSLGIEFLVFSGIVLKLLMKHFSFSYNSYVPFVVENCALLPCLIYLCSLFLVLNIFLDLINFFIFSTGKSAYVVKFDEQAIKTEIYRNGPVQGSVKMYSDLYSYKTGKFISVLVISLHEKIHFDVKLCATDNNFRYFVQAFTSSITKDISFFTMLSE